MMVAPRRHQHHSSGANRPPHVTVTVNFNAQFNLIAVNPIMDCISRNLVPKYCQGIESSTVYTAPPFCVESLCGRSNRSPPCLPLHMHAEEIIPTYLGSSIYIGLFLPKPITLTQLRAYEMFEVLLIVRINKTVGVRGILNFRMLRDVYPYRVARGIPLKEGVLYPLQFKVRTAPRHLCGTIPALQISLNA